MFKAELRLCYSDALIQVEDMHSLRSEQNQERAIAGDVDVTQKSVLIFVASPAPHISIAILLMKIYLADQRDVVINYFINLTGYCLNS